MIASGKFRQDLYYRLNVVTLQLPSLSDRTSDIPLLADYFLRRSIDEIGGAQKTISDDAMQILSIQKYPGNVRELKNLIERINIYCDDPLIDVDDVNPFLPLDQITQSQSLKEAVENFEREYISQVLAQNNGSMAKAARFLGLERSHLYKKINKLKIERSG